MGARGALAQAPAEHHEHGQRDQVHGDRRGVGRGQAVPRPARRHREHDRGGHVGQVVHRPVGVGVVGVGAVERPAVKDAVRAHDAGEAHIVHRALQQVVAHPQRHEQTQAGEQQGHRSGSPALAAAGPAKAHREHAGEEVGERGHGQGNGHQRLRPVEEGERRSEAGGDGQRVECPQGEGAPPVHHAGHEEDAEQEEEPLHPLLEGVHRRARLRPRPRSRPRAYGPCGPRSPPRPGFPRLAGTPPTRARGPARGPPPGGRAHAAAEPGRSPLSGHA